MLLLGCTGSIGTQTLEVIDHLNALHARGEWPTRHDVVGLAARRDSPALRRAAEAWRDAPVAVCDHGAAEPWDGPRVRHASDAAERLVRDVEADLVVCAMVGIAGLPATLAAAELGRTIALANKESLVAGGALVTAAAARSGAALLPIDSEHSALWQCLPGGPAPPPLDAPPTVTRAILTASGGPFRSRTASAAHHATPAEALNHPTWRMGPKVSIDSATLMNKALELVEAHWLFGLGAERLDVLIHPQSIVHAIVETTDGQAFAQLAAPDMRTPIQAALTHPRRAPAAGLRLDWAGLSRLEFAHPDPRRWPALGLAYDAIRRGGTCGAAMNAANEAAVEAFLGGRLAFGAITDVVARAVRETASSQDVSLSAVMEADAAARTLATRLIPG